jgi:N-acetylmuramoyl-L-alanine amidase-like protein
MTARAITRRSLLAMSAGALAGGLTRPGSALGALAGPPRPSLQERWLGDLAGAPVTIELSRVADMVALEWQAPAQAKVELRFRGAGRPWSRWVPAGPRGHGPEGRAASPRLLGEPVWTGGASAVQLRSTRALSGVRLHLVDVSAGLGARRQAGMLAPLAFASALARATPLLDAGAGQPPIIARRAWAQGMAPPRVAPGYGSVEMAFVHHTENPNGYAPGEVPAMLRAIYVFHRYVNGWNDIGYNFVVDLYGRIFEARAGGIDEPVVGAHAGGYNLVSSGVAVLGSFMSTPISPAARRALEHLLAWKLSLHGLPAQGSVTVRVNPAGASYSRFPANARVALPRIAGHRDGDSTDCPGSVLYGELDGIRGAVQRLAAHPARATLALTSAPVSGAPTASTTPTSPGPATPPAPTGEPPVSGAPSSAPSTVTPSGAVASLIGTVKLLDGSPIVGARVLVQARTVQRKGELVRERTLGEAHTDADGQWSLPASFPAAAGAGPLWLRALCPASGGVGAAISAPLLLAPTRAPAGALSPPPAEAPTPPAAAPRAP